MLLPYHHPTTFCLHALPSTLRTARHLYLAFTPFHCIPHTRTGASLVACAVDAAPPATPHRCRSRWLSRSRKPPSLLAGTPLCEPRWRRFGTLSLTRSIAAMAWRLYNASLVTLHFALCVTSCQLNAPPLPPAFVRDHYCLGPSFRFSCCTRTPHELHCPSYPPDNRACARAARVRGRRTTCAFHHLRAHWRCARVPGSGAIPSFPPEDMGEQVRHWLCRNISDLWLATGYKRSWC